jgi:transcriptional regulator with XRE-family HTH domain
MSQGEPGVLRVVTPRALASSRPSGAEGGAEGASAFADEAADGATSSSHDPAADESTSGGSGLPSPGRYIREQRQRRGMSVEQLAAATKIPRTSVILLEEDRFDELPGPVFVKGFLRCAARALGVEADAVMELLYERERTQLNMRRRDRPAGPVRPSGSDGAAIGAARPAGVPARVPARVSPAAATDGVVPRMPPRVRKQAPPRSQSALRGLLTRMPSVSVLLWIVIAVLVAMVIMAAFNLVGHRPPGAT